MTAHSVSWTRRHLLRAPHAVQLKGHNGHPKALCMPAAGAKRGKSIRKTCGKHTKSTAAAGVTFEEAAGTVPMGTRALAEEFRRLSDMAITSQEHVDLRLTDLSVQVDALRDQLDQMQRILKEVE